MQRDISHIREEPGVLSPSLRLKAEEHCLKPGSQQALPRVSEAVTGYQSSSLSDFSEREKRRSVQSLFRRLAKRDNEYEDSVGSSHSDQEPNRLNHTSQISQSSKAIKRQRRSILSAKPSGRKSLPGLGEQQIKDLTRKNVGSDLLSNKPDIVNQATASASPESQPQFG